MRSLELPTPHLIAMIGIPGSGKTHFASQFSRTFNSPYLSDEILRLVPGEVPEKITTKINFAILKQMMKTRHTIVYEGPLDKLSSRLALYKLAKSNNYKTIFIWVQTDDATARNRWMKLYRAAATDFDYRLANFVAPKPGEPYIVISGRHTYSTQYRTLLKFLADPTTTSTRNRLYDRPETKNPGRQV